jgi:putative FmdB family regulatory protein
MPTYEYQCKTCGHRFEYMQSIMADALTHCPASECIQEDEEKKGTGDVVRRVSAGAGLVFKGEGFYLTDYARKGAKGGGEKGGSSSSSGSGSSSGSSSDKGSGSSGGGGESSSGSGESKSTGSSKGGDSSSSSSSSSGDSGKS